MNLATRVQAEELMDADDLPAEVYAAVVADLARVNGVTLAARPTLAFLDRALAGRKTVRLLDVGFGDGDMLRRIARWADRRGIVADLAPPVLAGLAVGLALTPYPTLQRIETACLALPAFDAARPEHQIDAT